MSTKRLHALAFSICLINIDNMKALYVQGTERRDYIARHLNVHNQHERAQNVAQSIIDIHKEGIYINRNLNISL